MDSHLPIHDITRGLEIREQSDAHLERGQLLRRDGGEAVVGKRRREGVGTEAFGERLRFKGADAAAEGFLAF